MPVRSENCCIFIGARLGGLGLGVMVGVILVNLSDTDFVVNDGDRICQMVIAKHEIAEIVEVETLDETERNAGGFGHSGI